MVRQHSISVPGFIIRSSTEVPGRRSCVSATLSNDGKQHRVVFLFSTAERARRFLSDQSVLDWEHERLETVVLLEWLIAARNSEGADVALINARATGTAKPYRAILTKDLIHILGGTSQMKLAEKVFSLWFM